MRKNAGVPPPLITDEELKRIWTIPKDCGLTMDELFDESRAVLQEGHGDVNRRWRQRFISGGHRMTIAVRILDQDPSDFSLLLFVSLYGEERCICRLDSKGRHSMGWAGLPDIVGPHMHWLRECDQAVTHKDDAWAEPIDIHGFNEGMAWFIACLNITAIG